MSSQKSSLKSVDSLWPLILRMKRSIRYWWWSNLFFWLFFIGICLLAAQDGTYKMIAAGIFIVWLIVVLILYFKNHKRTVWLRRVFVEFEDVKQVAMLSKTYKSLVWLLNIIFWIDFALWPVTGAVKFVFWILYRKFRLETRRLKKAIMAGTVTIKDDDIENDPFYSFLMKEGLYSPKQKNLLESVELVNDSEEGESK